MSLKKFSLLLLCLCLSLSALSARAQDTLGNSVRPSPASGDAAMHGRLVLLLPFENRSNDATVDWIGTAFPDIFSRRLAGADYLPLGREDRLYAFDHLGLPGNLVPSRALTIRIAQLVDADYVIVGSYKVEGNRITAQAQILDMAALTLTKPIEVNAALPDLLNAINSLAWRVVRKMDPHYAVAEQTFLAADGKLPPAAYESYIRGLIAPALTDQITDLKESIRIAPDFFPAWMQLGLAYFADQDYQLCAATLGHLPRYYSRATEADFYRGLSFFYLGDYAQAENAFAFVSESMPLPEVLNNEGVAASRRGQPAADFFRKAIAADPKNENYHFNLGVTLERQHDVKGAIAELQTALKLNPNDTDAQSFLETLQTPPAANPDPGQAIADTDTPLERIQRHYDGASVRQAAFELEQMQEMRLATMPAPQRATALVKDGDQFLDRGLILEAEREYHAALTADSHSAMAHAGLAEVRERSGDDKAAKREAKDSLALEPNAEAHLVLARLDMAQKNNSGAKSEVAAALKLDPGNAAAHSLNDALNQLETNKAGASKP
ncbi:MULTISPECIES: tetratricopeptide repeat protein [Acidobacterium]|uniref:Conserved domain protein n=1 Tax=Acidobacterium capsulatum (strain ATCC 51196 / DSM 11244 / BCRC 80197 / JCM 7670 / NBRC 15755 / NCIMB 13165 / 161) TaxID=240015 RepID=C1F6D7_ACIC5|nr:MULTISPECIES: tetratricopeptide repeat protein [Acidobacterium]ACO32735.1 conserved domain protein [Acidobacterium capsulatum ATCC 51196]HCT60728.1 tetratricopeptide repeat protein [Acidobacterium sp.]